MTTILELLSQTPDQYEDAYFDAYWRWCKNQSTNDAQLQMILANAAINRYYNIEFAKCEARFLSLIALYPYASVADAHELYRRCSLEMFDRKSVALLIQANKNLYHDQRTT